MRCSTIKKRLEAYLDGELAPREKASAEEHFAACPACREVLDERRALRTLVHEQFEVSAPEDLKAAIIAARSVEEVGHSRGRAAAPARHSFWRKPLQGIGWPWQWRHAAPLLAGATAVIALLIVQRMISDRGPGELGESSAFSRPGQVIVIRYGESSPGRAEVMMGGLVLGDPL